MENVILRDNGYEATIELKGAQLVSLKDKTGREYIWQRDPEVWPKCSPILFPVIGNLKDNKIKINGVEYTMGKHGILRDAPYEITEQTTNSVTMVTRYTEETLTAYPFKYEVTMKFILNNGKIKVMHNVKNIDDKEMIYCIGAHPGLICPLYDGECLEDYVLKFEHTETTSSVKYDLVNQYFDANSHEPFLENSDTFPLSYEAFVDDAIFCNELKSREVKILNPKTNKGVSVAFPGFETVAFWTKYGDGYKNYVCVEPWNGSAVFSDEVKGEFKEKRGALTLNPNSERLHIMDIEILD